MEQVSHIIDIQLISFFGGHTYVISRESQVSRKWRDNISYSFADNFKYFLFSLKLRRADKLGLLPY